MQNNKSVSLAKPAVSRYLLAGLVSGVVAAILANIYYAIYQAATGNSFAELNIFTITIISIIVSVIGGLVYYALNRYTKQPLGIFVAIGLIFATLTVVPNFISPPNPAPGFAVAASPLHYLVAIVALIVIPIVSRNQA